MNPQHLWGMTVYISTLNLTVNSRIFALAPLSRMARPCWYRAVSCVCLVTMAVRWERRPQSMLGTGRSRSAWWIPAAETIKGIRGQNSSLFLASLCSLHKVAGNGLCWPGPTWVTWVWEAQTQKLGILHPNSVTRGLSFALTLLSTGHSVSLECLNSFRMTLDLRSGPGWEGLTATQYSAFSCPKSYGQQVPPFLVSTSAMLRIHLPTTLHTAFPFS